MTDFEPHGEAPPPTSLPLDYRAPNSSNQPGGRPATSLPYPHPIDTRVGPTHTPNDAETVQSAMQTDSGAASANPMSGAGAGPLPASFGVPAGASGGSTLTEFTKRRNWSQRVLEELKDFLHILTPDGRILYASPSAERLTGHAPAALVGRFIVEFIHADDSATFVREFNESIASGNPLRFFYRFRTAAGAYAIFESHGHAHLSSEPGGGGTVGSAGASGPAAGGGGAGAPGYCRGFFMMARPYPTKNAGLLDSFLEHKIENERLTRRIADLKREEREEDEAQQRQFAEGGGRGGPSGSFPPSDSRGAETDSAVSGGLGGASGAPTPGSGSGGGGADAASMPPPAKPSSGGSAASNTALTAQNLSEANAARRADSITDKMARYEGATHIETIEMLTGLRYRDGERSQGLSTGDASAALIRGDAGIPVAADRDGRGGSAGGAVGAGGAGAAGGGLGGAPGDKRNKKLKVADEYVCTDCGTLDSPEWRKGPSGPKTLCNACGRTCPPSEFRGPTMFGACGANARGSAVGEEGEEAHALRALAHGDRPAGAAARGREPGDERPVTLVSTIAPYIALLRELSVLAKLHHNRSRRRTSGVVRPWLGQRPTGFGAIPCLRRLGGS